MTDKYEKRWVNRIKTIESILNYYIKENNLSLSDDISEILVYNCRFRVANILHLDWKESRRWILICLEGMQYKNTHSVAHS